MTKAQATPLRVSLIATVACIAFASLAVWLYSPGEKLDHTSADSRQSSSEQVVYAEAVLDEATQKYIWDLEHFTFELEQRLLPRVAERTSVRTTYCQDRLRCALLNGVTIVDTLLTS